MAMGEVLCRMANISDTENPTRVGTGIAQGGPHNPNKR